MVETTWKKCFELEPGDEFSDDGCSTWKTVVYAVDAPEEDDDRQVITWRLADGTVEQARLESYKGVHVKVRLDFPSC